MMYDEHILKQGATLEEIERFLLFHEKEADGRKSKINPSLTKKQIWQINMGAVKKGAPRTREIMIRNIIKEFGEYYE